MNQIILSGRLCAEPELKTTANGINVCSCRIAVDRGYGDKKQTDFIPVVFWRGNADVVSTYCQKGDKIYLIGELITKTYEKNGIKVFGFEITVSSFEFGESKKTEPAEEGLPF